MTIDEEDGCGEVFSSARMSEELADALKIPHQEVDLVIEDDQLLKDYGF